MFYSKGFSSSSSSSSSCSVLVFADNMIWVGRLYISSLDFFYAHSMLKILRQTTLHKVFYRLSLHRTDNFVNNFAENSSKYTYTLAGCNRIKDEIRLLCTRVAYYSFNRNVILVEIKRVLFAINKESIAMIFTSGFWLTFSQIVQ